MKPKKLLIPLYFVAIPGVPSALTFALLFYTVQWPVVFLAVFLSPILFAFVYVLTAGALSCFHQHNVLPGLYPRDTNHPVYLDRRLYSLCLTSVFYCTPIYMNVLYVEPFRRLYFRLFGYRGPLDFTIHPDTWIRDLPLVTIGSGAYIANQTTIGTNIVTSDNHIRVDRISIGDHAILGAHSKLAPGVVIGPGTEVGIGTMVGSRTKIGASVHIEPDCAIGHHVKIGNRAIIGRRSELDVGARVLDDAVVPPFSRYLGNGTIERA